MTQKIFSASDDALEEVNDFLDAELVKYDIPLKLQIQLKIALEEIFVNVAHYAYPDCRGTVQVDLDAKNHEFMIRFTDTGTPFDPLAKPDPDISLPAGERPIGGLGIFMVKKTMDRVNYEYLDGKNIFTMYKNF